MRLFESINKFNKKMFGKLGFLNKHLSNSQLYKGFTLSEILIVIGIIGTIANLTIPQIIASVEEQKLKTLAKETYSTLTQAAVLIRKDNGVAFDSGHTTGTELLDLFKAHLQYNKACADSGAEGCFGTNYRRLSGAAADPTWSPDYAGIILTNGVSVAIGPYFYSESCTAVYSATLQTCGVFTIDVNGAKRPNKYGEDVFVAYITKDRIIPAGAPGAVAGYFDHACPVYGYSCFANVINNIDY